MNSTKNKEFQLVIRPTASIWETGFKEILDYKDLVFLFVRRDFVSFYKQTILGPLWLFIHPLISTFAFTLVFYKIGKMGTANKPPVLFYLSGLVFWNYFNASFIKTSDVFVANAHIFSKIYFPRTSVPFATILSNMNTFFIQLLLLTSVFIFYRVQGHDIAPTWGVLLLPFITLQLALLALGCGFIFSSLTTKYRDFNFLVGVITSLWMYASPIIYPVDLVPEAWRNIYLLNPLAPALEFARFALLGGEFNRYNYLFISTIISVFVFFIGYFIFQRSEKTFIDTV